LSNASAANIAGAAAPLAAAEPLAIRSVFMKGSVLLGAGSAGQRLLSFIAITLAARTGGPAILGAYSLALSTSSLVTSYSGMGIGVTASRFVGQFARDTAGYRKTMRILLAMFAIATVAAVAALLIAAEPFARLVLGEGSLATLVRFSALTALVMLAYEFVNGLLVGAFSFHSALWLGLVSGTIMVLVLGVAARAGAPAMLVAHAFAFGCGVLVAVVTAWRLIKPLPITASSVSPNTTELILFGASQALATVAIAVASWWVTVQITRHDISLHQMGYYMVGNQLKAIAAAGPNLIAQMMFPMLTRLQGAQDRQGRMIAGSTTLCVGGGVLVGGGILVFLPLIVSVFGATYSAAISISVFMIAMSVLQVGGVPTAQYLATIDLRAITIINVVWAASLAALATLLVPRYGLAGAGIAWVIAQIVSQLLVLVTLRMRRQLPRTVTSIWFIGASFIGALAWLALKRPEAPGLIFALQSALLLMAIAVFWKHSINHAYLSPPSGGIAGIAPYVRRVIATMRSPRE
jgi:O-antigen/teichoic acid export membrane protein